MPEPGTPIYPKVGTSVGYYASQASAMKPAQIAQDLGGGRYNLRVLALDGSATPQPNVLFIDALSSPPASGEYCKLPGQL